MTYPRSHLVDPAGGIYQVCSRCVRRAFLCGKSKDTGFNFEHRRGWIEARILELAQIFPIDIFGYAVMSNHYHVVLRVNPEEVSSWTNQEIANKWMMLNPRKRESQEHLNIRIETLLQDKERLLELRERFASLSWFMRYLNEPLARRANKEDNCTGRFWEGRFKSQRLLDEEAILACMVYVDLNPVRAGMVEDVTRAEHTSLAKRLNQGTKTDKPLQVINRPELLLPFTLTLQDYIQFARWAKDRKQTSRSVRPKGLTAANLLVLERMPKPGRWQRALGTAQSMKLYAEELGQRWIRTSPA